MKNRLLRYGLIRSWFQRARYKGNGPGFIKLEGRVLHHVKKTDNWFESRIIEETRKSKLKSNAQIIKKSLIKLKELKD
jgi:hypothetical protein